MERNELLLAITRCPELGKARADSRHPCRSVVCAQGSDDYHVPEPWQGHIETAPILFISPRRFQSGRIWQSVPRSDTPLPPAALRTARPAPGRR